MCELARSTHKNQSYFYILAINHWKLKWGGGRWGAAHVSYDSPETNEIGLNLIKHVRDLKTMKHWRRKSKSTDISGQTCSWIGRLNIVIKISFLHKLICRFNIIPESQQGVFFFVFLRDKMILKLIWKVKLTRPRSGGGLISRAEETATWRENVEVRGVWRGRGTRRGSESADLCLLSPWDFGPLLVHFRPQAGLLVCKSKLIRALLAGHPWAFCTKSLAECGSHRSHVNLWPCHIPLKCPSWGTGWPRVRVEGRLIFHCMTLNPFVYHMQISSFQIFPGRQLSLALPQDRLALKLLYQP